MICSESTLISIALSELQMKILRRDDLSQAWASRTDVLMAFETALAGCMIVFSCLEAETRQLQSQNSSSMGVWAKIRFMWNQDRLKDLLNALRGQQTSIGFLLKLLETGTLSDIKRSLRDNRSRIQAGVSQAQSLRSRNPSIKMGCESIFDNDTAKFSLFDIEAVSAVAPSELDFEFDDLVLNSQAYRRAFARAQADTEQPHIHVVEGDLIDFSEAQSSIDNSDAATIRELNQDLQGLSMGIDLETSTGETNLQQPQQRRNSYCDKCSGPILGNFARALDGVWHIDCFTCADCNQGVAARFFPHDDNGTQKPLCERDYFRRLDLLCFKCDQALRESYISALDRKYHLDHFMCDDCGVIFNASDSYYEYENKLVCVLDYLKAYASRCEACKFPILARFVDSADFEDGPSTVWHPECYMIKKELGVVLSLSSRNREYLDLLDKGVELKGSDMTLSKLSDIQDQHEAFLVDLKVATLHFVEVFQETAETVLASKENLSQAFEHWIILIAFTDLLFRLVAEVTEGAPTDKQIARFSTATRKYAIGFLRGTNPLPDSLSNDLTVVVRQILRDGLQSVLVNEDHSKLNKFITKLSATSPPELHLPYQGEPPSIPDQGYLCEGCHQYVMADAYTETSMRKLRWHPKCWACVACKDPGILTPTPSRNTDGHFQCSSLKCGWAGVVTYIPSYSQAVYLMWLSWNEMARR
ncbi:hypothetical protein Neosp_002956 [[Neocosmospora] mangrovei]